MSTVNYKLAIEGWAESERIVIRNRMTSPSVIASFPLDFVWAGGDNTWQYILDMVENVVDPEPGHPGIITDSAGLEVDLEASPTCGDFWFKHSGEHLKPAGVGRVSHIGRAGPQTTANNAPPDERS